MRRFRTQLVKILSRFEFQHLFFVSRLRMFLNHGSVDIDDPIENVKKKIMPFWNRGGQIFCGFFCNENNNLLIRGCVPS